MNSIKTTLLMAALFGLFMFIGSQIGGQRGMIWAFLLAAVMNFGAYWFSDKIVLMMHGAQEVDERTAPEFVGLVRELAHQANLPMPRVYVIPDASPNAFATGRDPNHAAVAATQGIFQILSYEELRGVMAHELAHVQHRDILISTIAATMAGAITFLAQMARWGMMFGGLGRDDRRGGLGDLFMLILAPVAAFLIQMAISRSREFKADEGGGHISGNPLALASALGKLQATAPQIPFRRGREITSHMYIVHPFAGGLASLFSTHPRTEERIARLEAMARGGVRY
jgi:heat shock protein HtpX